jgi:hypothetical protein
MESAILIVSLISSAIVYTAQEWRCKLAYMNDPSLDLYKLIIEHMIERATDLEQHRIIGSFRHIMWYSFWITLCITLAILSCLLILITGTVLILFILKPRNHGEEKLQQR